MTATMFERYGGFASVSRIVSAFYDKALDSPVLSPYFEGVDMRRLIDHQTKFIASLMGGPASFSDDELERKHARLGITEGALHEMCELLTETLEDFEVEERDVETVRAEILARRRCIVQEN